MHAAVGMYVWLVITCLIVVVVLAAWYILAVEPTRA